MGLLSALFRRRTPPPTLFTPTGEKAPISRQNSSDNIVALLQDLPADPSPSQLLISALVLFLSSCRRGRLVLGTAAVLIAVTVPVGLFTWGLAQKLIDRGAQKIAERVLPDSPSNSKLESPPRHTPADPPGVVPSPATVPVLDYDSSTSFSASSELVCELRLKALESATGNITFYVSAPENVYSLSPQHIVNKPDEQDAMGIDVTRLSDTVDRWMVRFMAKDQVLVVRYTVKFRALSNSKAPQFILKPNDPTRRILFRPSVIPSVRLAIPSLPDSAQTVPLPVSNKSSYESVSLLAAGSVELGVTRYAYDALGRRTAATDPAGRTTTFEYNDENLLVAVTNPLLKTTSYDYDSENRLISLSSSSGSATYTYDANGNLASVTDAQDMTTRFAYDPLGKLSSTTDPLGHTTSYQFDANGRLVQVTRPTGDAIYYVYDELDRLSTVGDDMGSVSFAYDASGNRIVSVVDGGVVTTNTLDEIGRVIPLVDVTNNERLEYEAVGNVIGSSTKRGTASLVADANASFTQDDWILVSTSGTNGRLSRTVWSPLTQSFAVLNNSGGSGFVTIPLDSKIRSSSDVYYVRARYYDPQIGRFVADDRYSASAVISAACEPISGTQPLCVDIAADGGTHLRVSSRLLRDGVGSKARQQKPSARFAVINAWSVCKASLSACEKTIRQCNDTGCGRPIKVVCRNRTSGGQQVFARIQKDPQGGLVDVAPLKSALYCSSEQCKKPGTARSGVSAASRRNCEMPPFAKVG